MHHRFVLFVGIISALVLTGQACVSFGGSKKNTALGPSGVWVTTENGESWNQIVSVPTGEGVQKLPFSEVYKFVDDPQDVHAFYWASRENGLLYTYDDGKTWSQSAAPLNVGLIHSVSVHPSDKCTIFASNGRQLLKTVDCTRTWSEIYREGRTQYILTSVSVNPFNSNQVFAATSAGDLYMSLDGGNAWQVIARFNGVDIREIVFDANKQGTLYLATRDDGLYRSKDSGNSWENLKDKFKEYAGALQFRRFVVYPSAADQIYWVSKYGILTSRNAGDDWEPIPLVTPPGSVTIYGFGVNPRNNKEMYYTGTIEDRSTFYRSVDGGTTWETRKLPTRQTPTALRVHPENSGWIYLGFTTIIKK
jgi:photosystem II stability/assembly factor-like uncharacterized protein